MKFIFTIHTTPLGVASGLDETETIVIGESDNFSRDAGMLAFEHGKTITIYAPGTWAMVTAVTEEE